MSDYLQPQDLIDDKKHSTFFAEVITGKAGGVSGGASIDTATNAVTSQVQKTMPKIMVDAESAFDAQLSSQQSEFNAQLQAQGWNPVAGSFETGGTIVNRRDILWWEAAKAWYSWQGIIPPGGYVVPSGSTPATSGGVSSTAWVDRTDGALRGELGDIPLAMSYVLNTIPDHSDAYEYALNSGRTVIVDIPLTLTRAVVKSENDPVSVRFINGAKVVPADYAPRLRSNPEHRITSDSERRFFPQRVGDLRHETCIAYDGVVTGRTGTAHQNMVTAYYGADSVDSPNARIWAINTVTNVHKDANSNSEAFGYELDVNVDADNTGSTGLVQGLRIAGVGDFSQWQNAYGIDVMRNGDGLYKWQVGARLRECVDGLHILDAERFAALIRGNKPFKFIPNATLGNKLILINDHTDTVEKFYVTDDGLVSADGGLVIGKGARIFQNRTLLAPGVGFGDIPAGAQATKSFSELFGDVSSFTFVNCALSVTVAMTGGLPAQISVDSYVDAATGMAHVRVKNTGSTTFLNTGITIRATVVQY